MPTIETILNKGFTRDGGPWDGSPARKALLLWVLPLCALVVAVAGGSIIYHDVQANYPVGYVVSSARDCTLVVASRPDGPPVDTVQEHGGKYGGCGGLAKNQKIYYDPHLGVQAFGKSNNVAGMVVLPIIVLAVLVPSALAWIDIRRKRRARRQAPPSPDTPGA